MTSGGNLFSCIAYGEEDEEEDEENPQGEVAVEAGPGGDQGRDATEKGNTGKSKHAPDTQAGGGEEEEWKAQNDEEDEANASMAGPAVSGQNQGDDVVLPRARPENKLTYSVEELLDLRDGSATSGSAQDHSSGAAAAKASTPAESSGNPCSKATISAAKENSACNKGSASAVVAATTSSPRGKDKSALRTIGKKGPGAPSPAPLARVQVKKQQPKQQPQKPAVKSHGVKAPVGLFHGSHHQRNQDHAIRRGHSDRAVPYGLHKHKGHQGRHASPRDFEKSSGAEAAWRRGADVETKKNQIKPNKRLAGGHSNPGGVSSKGQTRLRSQSASRYDDLVPGLVTPHQEHPVAGWNPLGSPASLGRKSEEDESSSFGGSVGRPTRRSSSFGFEHDTRIGGWNDAASVSSVSSLASRDTLASPMHHQHIQQQQQQQQHFHVKHEGAPLSPFAEPRTSDSLSDLVSNFEAHSLGGSPVQDRGPSPLFFLEGSYSEPLLPSPGARTPLKRQQQQQPQHQQQTFLPQSHPQRFQQTANVQQQQFERHNPNMQAPPLSPGEMYFAAQQQHPQQQQQQQFHQQNQMQQLRLQQQQQHLQQQQMRARFAQEQQHFQAMQPPPPAMCVSPQQHAHPHLHQQHPQQWATPLHAVPRQMQQHFVSPPQQPQQPLHGFVGGPCP